MQYKLMENTGRGVLIDRTPVMQDIRDTYTVSFLLPKDGAYVVLFRGADGAEYRKTIKDGVCKVPREILTKEQFVDVTVCETDGEKILQSWDCEPLKVTAFAYLRRTQWELSGGITAPDVLTRLIGIETTINDIPELRRTVGELLTEVAALREHVAGLSRENAQLQSRTERAEANIIQINKYVEDPLGGR